MKRYLLFMALTLFLYSTGCTHRIDVQHYPFGSPMHHAENGMEFIDMGFTEDALREFDTALSDNPRFSPALAGKGIYWAIEGMPDVSEGYIELAKRYATQDSEKIFVLLASMRVSLTIGSDRWLDRVTRDFDEIIAISPGNERALFWMGVSLLKAGRVDEARKDLEKVVEIGGTYEFKARQYLKEMK